MKGERTGLNRTSRLLVALGLSGAILGTSGVVYDLGNRMMEIPCYSRYEESSCFNPDKSHAEWLKSKNEKYNHRMDYSLGTFAASLTLILLADIVDERKKKYLLEE